MNSDKGILKVVVVCQGSNRSMSGGYWSVVLGAESKSYFWVFTTPTPTHNTTT